MTKIRVIECPETGDVIMLNKIVKIKQYDIDDEGYYRYDILTTDNYYTSFYTKSSTYMSMFRTINL